VSDVFPFLIFSLVDGLLGAGLVYWSRKNARVAELIESTPTTPVRELCEGFHEAKGAVVPVAGTEVSPMSQKTCVHYEFTVKEARTRRSGKHTRTEWVTVVHDRQSLPFALDDGTGQVGVDLNGAELTLARDAYASSGFLSDAPPELERLLQQRYGRSTQGWVFNKSMRYEETVLEPGDELYVLGNVQVAGDRLCFVPGGELYLVSDGSEEAVLASYSRSAFWMGALGGVMLVAALVAPLLGPIAFR
jgi:hypothetical protein